MLLYLKYTTNRIHCIKFCTNVTNKEKTSYSKTVLLPQTKFPLNLTGKKLIERDAFINNSPQFSKLYEWQRAYLKEPEFVLHDGPPYANGLPHMGHAINKILKDAIVRYKILQRQKVHFVPGWDCHGLPIELKAITNTKDSTLSKLQIREKARNFATNSVETQRKFFISWGVTGNWENAYTTFSSSYIKNQMKQFNNLHEKKLIYRDVKPVYWSPSSRTALAEAELEYKTEHKSTAVTVKAKLKSLPQFLGEYRNSPLYALLWTTTPWSLPSNQAICYNPSLSYSIVQDSTTGDHYVVGTNLVESISKQIERELKIVKSFQGHALKGTTYIHPLYKSTELIFLPASHVSEAKGTGLVHTAPAHGPEDFLVALDNNLPVTCMVDERGCYNSEAGPELLDLFVLTDGVETVLKIIGNDVLQKETYIHSYPYDWRTKQPVILRASKQWFINTNNIKGKALELLTNVDIIPRINSEIYRRRFATQLENRPYWCISRQRSWGVPIPVFYETSTDTPIINKEIIEHLCSLLDKHGTDYWWMLPINELLPNGLLKRFNLTTENITKGQDILDIWFDSGISWSSVLCGEQVADMYLEGADQFTGWFQSSLLTSAALRDKSPYKTIYVHGFALDEKGIKMSKSLGNVIDPQDIMKGNSKRKGYGVDTLRWWVACHANQDSTTNITTNVLQASYDEVQKIRSVLRFALGAVYDYKDQDVHFDSLKIIDKYMLHLLWNFQGHVSELMINYQFNKVCTSVINLLTNPVSALYYNSIKDRLYCDSVDSVSRRSAQYVLYRIFYIVTRTVAPFIPHLAEELYMHLPQKSCDSFFQTDILVPPSDWASAELEHVMENVLNIKRDINKQVGASTLDKCVNISISAKMCDKFKSLGVDINTLHAELADIYQVADVHVLEDHKLSEFQYVVEVEESALKICPRCRKFTCKMEYSLCYRCSLIIENDFNKAESLV